MTIQNVTMEIGGHIVAHFVLTPNPKFDTTTGTGVTRPSAIRGWANPNLADWSDDTINFFGPNITFQMDDAYTWDINISFRGAAPIRFQEFIPSSGDLLELLTAQGWVAGQSGTAS